MKPFHRPTVLYSLLRTSCIHPPTHSIHRHTDPSPKFRNIPKLALGITPPNPFPQANTQNPSHQTPRPTYPTHPTGRNPRLDPSAPASGTADTDCLIFDFFMISRGFVCCISKGGGLYMMEGRGRGREGSNKHVPVSHSQALW